MAQGDRSMRYALCAAAALLALAESAASGDTSANGSHIIGMACAVYFSPNGGAQQQIIGAIAAARSSIRMAAYEITVKAIADALIAAHGRGVDVRIIVDHAESLQSFSQAQPLANAGIDVSYDPAVTLHHNKFLTIDGYSLITGSYNFSQAAESRNAENMLLCHSTSGAAIYNSYWAQVRMRTIAIAPVAPAAASTR